MRVGLVLNDGLVLAVPACQYITTYLPTMCRPPAAHDGRAVDLVWRDLTYSIELKKGRRQILDAVSGHLEAASLLAIMGPSGSGKSSLLNALAGRVPITAKATLQGVGPC